MWAKHQKLLMMEIFILGMISLSPWIQLALSQSDFMTDKFTEFCKVEEDHPGTFSVLCSCNNSNQNLSISSSATASLPSTVTQFHVHDCNDSLVVLEANALTVFHQLQNVSFTTIGNLVLESDSANLHLLHSNDFLMHLERIQGAGVFLDHNAINITRDDGLYADEDLIVQDTIIRGLEELAIHGNFSRLELNKVTLINLAATNSISIGNKGTDLLLNSMHATIQGLSKKWISGSARSLTIKESNLVMKPGAFAGINMTGNSIKIAIENNQFGVPERIPVNNEMQSHPSLPCGVFDFGIPSIEVSISADNNQISCECKDLSWLLETSKNHIQNKFNFQCVEGNLATALDNCPSICPNSSPSLKSIFVLFLFFSFFLMLM